ncbi:sigma-70 family RNA polymerase sigma factor [Bacillus sp. 31A1R]|uniref:Sigma-70 family RNA polymerase sigma factor n=1 Tax=Robertmurraya mangrovi TaxID=3098077 RepID=A0ABU5IW99_9BACI|nr:sigma-70 family RNA polymerase sigma factor [Bacillus sp. 31A1R]MDZ5471438.1 sigma-70 family RNA polymerase sigma factor [Bacillus sp. 31A1R]
METSLNEDALIEMNIEAQLEAIMIEYGTELSLLAYTYVKNVETSKDIVQNVFIKCYKHLHSFQGHSTVKTWLYRITINECKDFLRSAFFRKVIPIGLIKDEQKQATNTPETALIYKSNQQEMLNTILLLPPKYREVILLFYIQELSHQEIIETLGINSNTLKTRLSRAKARLHTIMEEEFKHGQ